jgi:hypothetical protein
MRLAALLERLSNEYYTRGILGCLIRFLGRFPLEA